MTLCGYSRSTHTNWVRCAKMTQSSWIVKNKKIITMTSEWARWQLKSLADHDCLLNRLFRRRSKKTSKFRVTGLCAGNSPVTGEFPAQMASNADFFFTSTSVSILLRPSDDVTKDFVRHYGRGRGLVKTDIQLIDINHMHVDMREGIIFQGRISFQERMLFHRYYDVLRSLALRPVIRIDGNTTKSRVRRSL